MEKQTPTSNPLTRRDGDDGSKPTPTPPLYTSPHDKATGGGNRHMQAKKRKPAKGRWRADRRRQPLGSKLRGRVSKGEQKCSGEETTGAVEVAGGHAISVTCLGG
ncbi:hypothetical protein LINPERPRIM_LOCUS6576 [Linum perenne]